MRSTPLLLAALAWCTSAFSSFPDDVPHYIDEPSTLEPQPREHFAQLEFTIPSKFDRRQTTGRCGADGGGASCPDNLCCSEFGYCGGDDQFCSAITGCQPQYGRCGSQPSTPSSSSTPVPSSSSTPPPVPSSSSTTPVPPSSSSTTPVIPSSSSSSVTPPAPSGSLIVSTNGACGNTTTCAGSIFGSCCSEFYFCGTGASYCGTGCRSGFGNCGGGAISSSSPAPPSSSSTPAPPSSTPTPTPSSSSTPTPTPSSTSTPTPTPSSSSTPIPPSSTPASSSAPVPTNVSTDGTCGSGNGKTCTGSTFGTCCSRYGYCGNDPIYCRPYNGCQADYGTCVGSSTPPPR